MGFFFFISNVWPVKAGLIILKIGICHLFEDDVKWIDDFYSDRIDNYGGIAEAFRLYKLNEQDKVG